MPLDPQLEKLCSPGVPPGKRVAYWRKKRGWSQARLAREVGSAASTIGEIEQGETRKGSFLAKIAIALQVNLEHIEYARGEPEPFAQNGLVIAEKSTDEWPFPAIPRSKLQKLNKIERAYAESKLLEALADIETEHKRGRTG